MSLTIYPDGTKQCQYGTGICTIYKARGSNVRASSVTHYCQWKTGSGGSWGAAQYPHTVNVSNGNFSSAGECHVGSNTWLRYQIRINGRTYYTCERTQNQSSCTKNF
jgi:hypothetical protein